MKKTAFLFLMIGLISFCGITALAGDVPEGLLSNNSAVLFFGEVISYDATDRSITVLPTKKIKGDVDIDASRIYENVSLIGQDDFSLAEGEIYLMANYDDINPLYVFRTTTHDTETLKIEGIAGIDMWESMQKYLNEGAYEQKEAERLEQAELSANASDISPTDTPVSEPSHAPTPESTDTGVLQQHLSSYWWLGIIGIFALTGLVAFMRNRKK